MTVHLTPRSERTVWSCDRWIANRLIEARRDSDISQRRLAFGGCSAAYISRIESGERWPSKQVIEELASRLGVSEEWLAWGKEPKERYDPKQDVRTLLLSVPATSIFDAETVAAGERLRRWLDH